MTIKEYITNQCIDTDMQMFVDTGMRTEEEIRSYYNDELQKVHKCNADMFLLKIYDEYYGIETLLNKTLDETDI